MFNAYDGTMGITPITPAISNNNPIDWNGIINQVFAVGSHAISAFSGQNTGTQVGYNRSQGVFALSPSGATGSGGYNPYAGMSAEQLAAYQQSQGGLGADDAIGSIFGYVQRNPLVVGAVALGAYLLFREPPKRR